VQVTVQKIPGSKVVLEFSLEDQEVDKAIDRTYRRLVRDLRIPGFRPGKAPRFVVERYLGPGELRSRAIEDLAPELVSRAVEEHGLRTVGRASVEVLQQKPLRLKATVPVYPEVQLPDYRTISLNPPRIDPHGPEVESRLQSIRERKAKWEDLAEDRPASQGDLVVLEVAQDLEGAQPTEVQGILGKDQLVDELEAAVLGHRVGEVVEFQLKGQDETLVTYRATLKAVKVMVLPEADAELAASEGYDSLDEFREALRQQLQKEADERYYRELLDAVADASQVEIPEALIEQEALVRIANLEGELKKQGLSAEWLAAQSGTDLRGLLERMRPAAERDLRRYIVAEAIAKAEGLQPPEGLSLTAFVGQWLAERKRQHPAEATDDQSETELQVVAGTESEG
jgi:trigger factor